jgi:hypothetical protein
MLGKGYLCAVVTQDAANWLTPATVQIQRTDMQKRIDYRASIGRKYVPGSLEEQMQQHGQAAPANPSTDGSRQGWWTPQVQDSKHSGTNPTANGKRDLLVNQVNWATPRTGATDSSRPNNKGGIPLADQAKREQWATPIMGDSHLASTPEVAQKRIEEGKVTLSRQNPGKLNPRWVETLMGLPVGWTMPSCKSPVTIEQTSFASSATESCLPQPIELFEF